MSGSSRPIPAAFADLDAAALRRPPPLAPGDKVGVMAPAMPLAAWYPERFAWALEGLATALDVRPVVAPQATQGHDDYIAGTAEERARCLQQLLEDDEIRAVFFTTGGFNCADLLPLLDISTVVGRPKIVVGYSDNTSILLGLQAMLGWVTYHGPAVLTQFGEFPEPHPYTCAAFDAATRTSQGSVRLQPADGWTDEFLDWGTDAWRQRPRTLKDAGRFGIVRPGCGTGHLFGGNLETLNFLVGTGFLAVPRDIVLFWEATEAEASLPRIERALTQLDQTGVLARTRAMLVGRSPDARDFRGQTLRDTILRGTRGYDFPVLADIPFGHTDPIVTLPIGLGCTVDARADGQARIDICYDGKTAR